MPPPSAPSGNITSEPLVACTRPAAMSAEPSTDLTEVVASATSALELDAKMAKAFFRRGVALAKLIITIIMQFITHAQSL